MQLWENEKLISTSNNKEVILTSQRIRFETTHLGQRHMVSIMLEKISSIEVRYHSWVIILTLGILSILGGIYLMAVGGSDKEHANIFFLTGILMIVVFLLTRQHVITITPDGGARIIFSTRGMSRDTVLDFIDKVLREAFKVLCKLYIV